MKMKLFFLTAISGLMVILFTACGGNQNTEKQAESGVIQIDGSSTVYPITEAVAEEFRKSKPEIKISVALSGTGGGFKKFGRGEIDINDASRPIKPAEDSLAKSNNIQYTGLTVAYDGLAVMVHPENDWVTSMTVEELKMLWSPEAQGKIMRWNQIRPEWPDEEIHLFGAGVESGTYDYFTEVITGKSHSSRGDFTASEDDHVLVQGISTDKYALGFFGLAYYEENKEKLKLIGIDDGDDTNGAGPIMPSVETVKNKTYAPLGRPLFIYINSTAAARQEVKDFISFYLSNMGQLAEEVGYIPLTPEEEAAMLQQWNSFIGSTGTPQ
jgi:phosphate transport system substrate-binding protein